MDNQEFSKHRLREMAEAQRGSSPNFAPKARLVQDAPPAGGWQGWDTHRKVPGRGPPGLLIFAGVSAFCVWGLWRIAKSNQRRTYVVPWKANIFHTQDPLAFVN
jgi:hypothetical protein